MNSLLVFLTFSDGRVFKWQSSLDEDKAETIGECLDRMLQAHLEETSNAEESGQEGAGLYADLGNCESIKIFSTDGVRVL